MNDIMQLIHARTQVKIHDNLSLKHDHSMAGLKKLIHFETEYLKARN